ncbi:hypothetical protein C6341_g18115 [Phytophthora cactorum]|nr:hypothetical protein C6341_g18115 [Phytophthora cactorum]
MTTLNQFSTQNADESVSKSFATEPLHGPRSPENSCKETPQKLKRKRVRRERIELDKLRLESHKLETELALLQGIYKGRVPHEIHSKRRVAANSKTTHGYQLIAPRRKRRSLCGKKLLSVNSKRDGEPKLRTESSANSSKPSPSWQGK